MTVAPISIQCFTGGGFGENAYLVRTPEVAVAIDPGAAAPRMRSALVDDGRERPDAILLTHAHLDHVEGIPALVAGHAVPIWLHEADRPLYDAVQAQATAFGLRAPELPPPDRKLEGGRPVEVEDLSFDVLHVPGHSPGHVALRLGGTVFCGDVVFAGSIGRTDLPGGDHNTLLRSIREMILTLPDEVRLLPGHGPETTVGRERSTNPFLAGL